MALAGRKPKPEGQAVNRNRPVHDWTEIENSPFVGTVPDLPERRGGWPERTKQKWETWSSMPHCVLWSLAEWDFALDSLEIAAQFHDGEAKLATELRNRERVLGTTGDYRRDLRIRYVEPVADGPVAVVTSLADYRNL